MTCVPRGARPFILAATGLGLSASLSIAAGQGTSKAVAPPPAGERFQLTEEARKGLQQLWQASNQAKQERVACLGGYQAEGVSHLSRVELLTSEGADSLNVPASASIRKCGPPEWLGTVHTHIALRDGEHPYPKFSGADRGVMMTYWMQWNADGVFCLLYSDHDGHCESKELVGGSETHIRY